MFSAWLLLKFLQKKLKVLRQYIVVRALMANLFLFDSWNLCSYVDIRITAYYHKQHTSHMLDWMPLFRTKPDITFGTCGKWYLSAFLHSIFCDNHLMPKSYANKQRLECWHLGLKLESFVYLLLKDGSN